VAALGIVAAAMSPVEDDQEGEMTDRETMAVQLEAIAGQVRRWLDWHKESRERMHLTTDRDTAIMSLPVPMWPSHGQFENWVHALSAAAKTFRQDALLPVYPDTGDDEGR
jgi:hypothetical protein